MLVKCPVCQTEYELEPGKHQCRTCGVNFAVLPDGTASVSLADPDAAAGNDPDRTVPPKTSHEEIPPGSDFDPDRTVPNMRVRKERGELQVGDVVLRRYELLEKLGSGAMGVVFKCRDRISGVEYALKMVPPELARDAEAMEDVRENFKLVHGLKHPNIASMNFLDRDEYGAYFLIMEFAPGESLTQWIKRKWQNGRPDSAEVIHIVNQIAAALDYAHGQQILHRDIKPANVMVDGQGNVKVLDFGLASKVRSTMTALSITPANTSGTPHYLSPEQFKGKYPGPAADQYALGVLTYQMLAGHLPFEADDRDVLRVAVINEEPDPIGGIPPAIETAVRKALSKDPKQRYQNCAEFAAALKAAFSEPVCILKTEPKKPVRHTWIWAVLFVAAVVLVLVGVIFVSSSEARRRAEEEARLKKLSSGDIVLDLPGDVKLAMVKVEAGTFTMSASDGENWGNEKPHTATLTRDFYIGKTEVTQAQWKAVMGNNPSVIKGDDLPVENVSWNDAMEFCAKLNAMGKAPSGWKFTLPTETQWEYAARGGNQSKGYKYSGSNNVDDVAWYGSNSDCETHPVGTKKANELGLYDMNGNVFEWCLDDYQEDSSRVKPEFDRGNDRGGSERVFRGGSWFLRAWGCRSASRGSFDPGGRFNSIGFRLALVPTREHRQTDGGQARERHQAGTRIASLPSGNFTLDLPGNVKLELVKVEAGTFTMSASDGENWGNEKPHTATLTRDFYIGKTEVTQAQWKAVMGNNPSKFKGDDLPVEQVSWNEAMEFCAKLNSMGKAPSGWKFTLPTETQWEYAARGGNRSKGYKYSGSNNLDEVAWYYENSGDRRLQDSSWSVDKLQSNNNQTHPVATKGANELGLYDMSGNVWEWCLDDWGDSSRARPEFDRGNDQGGSDRVFRGGGWDDSARYCRSACRISVDPGGRFNSIGFRLALVPVQ